MATNNNKIIDIITKGNKWLKITEIEANIQQLQYHAEVWRIDNETETKRLMNSADFFEDEATIQRIKEYFNF